MKKTLVLCLLMMAALSGCSIEKIVHQNDERYMRPGALDAPLTGYYDTHSFIFLQRHVVTHQWPVTARACQYGMLPTLGIAKERYKGEKFFTDALYEADGSTWVAGSFSRDRPRNLDRFVRPTYKRQINTFDSEGKVTGRMIEQEQPGFTPICFEAWVGTGHSLAVRLYKSPMDERTIFYSKRPGEHTTEMIGDQVWWAWRYPIGDGPKAYGGEAWVRPIGNTDYTIAIELGVGPESLRLPDTHAKFKAMYRHLIESVHIEPLTPQIEAEHEALQRRAHELAREDCRQRDQRKVLDPWCRQLLQQP